MLIYFMLTLVFLLTRSNRPDVSILLDCGEGTVGQINRFYGSRAEDVIRNIKALHITHMHGDHHMGVMDLIRARQKYMPENRPPLLLMAPKKQFGALLNFYDTHFGHVCDEFIMIDNEDLVSMPIDHLQTELYLHILLIYRSHPD